MCMNCYTADLCSVHRVVIVHVCCGISSWPYLPSSVLTLWKLPGVFMCHLCTPDAMVWREHALWDRHTDTMEGACLVGQKHVTQSTLGPHSHHTCGRNIIFTKVRSNTYKFIPHLCSEMIHTSIITHHTGHTLHLPAHLAWLLSSIVGFVHATISSSHFLRVYFKTSMQAAWRITWCFWFCLYLAFWFGMSFFYIFNLHPSHIAMAICFHGYLTAATACTILIESSITAFMQVLPASSNTSCDAEILWMGAILLTGQRSIGGTPWPSKVKLGNVLNVPSWLCANYTYWYEQHGWLMGVLDWHRNIEKHQPNKLSLLNVYMILFCSPAPVLGHVDSSKYNHQTYLTKLTSK